MTMLGEDLYMLGFDCLSFALAVVSEARLYDRLSDIPSLDNYNYVIVGGGLFGSVVGNRLTEDSSTRVLILEAGPSNQGVFVIEVPGLQSFTETDTPYNWNYTSVPQVHLDNRTIDVPRGYVLGGSSSIHGMWYTRGSSADYDRWAEVIGDSGWSWDELQHYFIKSETLTAPADGRNDSGKYNPALHGTDGPLSVTLPGYTDVLDSLVMDRLDDEFPFILDYDDGAPLGFGWVQTTIRQGARSSAAASYLDPYFDRPNLDVLVNARVLRLTASYGDAIDTIEFQVGGEGPVVTVRPTTEILLAAGTIGSPQILLNSGVGDREELAALNISLVHHLPSVGKNLTEHPAVPSLWNTSNSVRVPDATRVFNEAVTQWNDTRTGRLSMAVGNTVGWHRMNMSDPDVQAIFNEFGDPAPGPNSPHIELLPSISSFNAVQNFEDATFVFDSVVLVPKSRGSVTLNPANPLGPPLIDYNIYSEPQDILVMRQAVKTVLRFLDSPAWQDFLGEPTLPGFADVINAIQNGDDNLDDILDAYIRQVTGVGLHVVGTCAMSPRDADWGVIDPDFHVKGLDRVRVIDSSFMPFIPSGHPQAVIYAAAERASDIIKGLVRPRN